MGIFYLEFPNSVEIKSSLHLGNQKFIAAIEGN
jgi:hypothetical protein